MEAMLFLLSTFLKSYKHASSMFNGSSMVNGSSMFNDSYAFFKLAIHSPISVMSTAAKF